MKKHLTTLFLFAATMLVAFSFTSCGEEVIMDDPNPVNPNSVEPVEFSSDGVQTMKVYNVSEDGSEEEITLGAETRTSMNHKREFFWEKGDKIWVYDDTRTWRCSEESDITGTQEQAKFLIGGTFGTVGAETSYNVVYTGYTNNDTTATSPTTVTIAHQQTQKAWNDGSHLGTSGDCATGVAYKKPGGYRFTLDHQASYLLIYPYLASTLSGNYTLHKIEVSCTTASEAPLGGEYDFTHDNGLPDIPKAGTAQQLITLNCGTDGFLLNRSVPDPTKNNSPNNHCFVVIAPDTRAISIEYFVTSAANPSETITFVKDIAAKDYVANGVYTFVHELKDAAIIYEDFEYQQPHRWGMTTDVNVSGGTYNTSTSRVTDGFWANVPSYEDVTQYYLSGGDIHWDNAAKYRYYSTGGSVGVYRAGWWVKKKQYITPGNGTAVYYVTKGRPAESELSKYFFIPALSQQRTSMTIWTSTPYDAAVAYYVDFSTYSVIVRMTYKSTAGSMLSKTFRKDGTPWFK